MASSFIQHEKGKSSQVSLFDIRLEPEIDKMLCEPSTLGIKAYNKLAEPVQLC